MGVLGVGYNLAWRYQTTLADAKLEQHTLNRWCMAHVDRQGMHELANWQNGESEVRSHGSAEETGLQTSLHLTFRSGHYNVWRFEIRCANDFVKVRNATRRRLSSTQLLCAPFLVLVKIIAIIVVVVAAIYAPVHQGAHQSPTHKYASQAVGWQSRLAACSVSLPVSASVASLSPP